MTPRDVWFRSIAIAAITLCLYFIVFAWIAPRFYSGIVHWLVGRGFSNRTAVFAMIALFAAPPIAFVAAGVNLFYRHLNRTKPADGETHCRRCNHILRGLTEPRCPECGERI